MATKIAAVKKSPGRRRSAAWHLVTNHQNMLYMLAAGMVMSPAGFQGKHYADSLSACPGWIPLFRDKKIPRAALSQAVSEGRHLLPCIASFDLSDLSGPVRMLRQDGCSREVTFPGARKHKDDIALLVRAPLSPSLLRGIYFRSPEDKQTFVRAAADVSNVDLRSQQIEDKALLFDAATALTWPAEQPQTPLIGDSGDHFPAFGQARGGVLAMLYHLANRSDAGLIVFRSITGVTKEAPESARIDPILAELGNWMNEGEISAHADIRARLFWGVIQKLVRAQTRDHGPAPVDVALAHLENQLDRLPETAYRPRLERLITDMRACFGLAGATVTELFEQHKGSLSRPLLLFCLRRHSTELLEFSHPLLNDIEYLLAGILFGVCDGWLRLPRELRDPDLSAYVIWRMTMAEQRKLKHDFNLIAPRRPIPLRELFATSGGKWNSAQREAALHLAHESGWDDCIQTRITLAKGNYPDSFKPDGLQLILPGRISAAEAVDQARFLRQLGQWPPASGNNQASARQKLAGARAIEARASGASCA